MMWIGWLVFGLGIGFTAGAFDLTTGQQVAISIAGSGLGLMLLSLRWQLQEMEEKKQKR